MEKLRECPFCGGEGYIVEGRLYFWGKCRQCGAESCSRQKREKAVESWNSRPREDALVKALEDANEVIPPDCTDTLHAIEALLYGEET